MLNRGQKHEHGDDCTCVTCAAQLLLKLLAGAGREALDMAATHPNFVWLLLFNSFLAYFTNLTNFLVRARCRLPLPLPFQCNRLTYAASPTQC